jgi:hypothetical protein
MDKNVFDEEPTNGAITENDSGEMYHEPYVYIEPIRKKGWLKDFFLNEVLFGILGGITGLILGAVWKSGVIQKFFE